jgi:hypothetical protein
MNGLKDIIQNVSINEDSITISKNDLEKLIKHYDKKIEVFWNPNPLSPQTWGVGLFQGKREMCEDFLKLIKGK